ncbi:MAG TPA: maleylpyruvate isomerase family mycothiol-dependent enzyme [Mycobacteriales bacterium]|nr:maleylpyruvate isomerase family mycothiol-dependent enzyme [Mycobacteriales bacterium]
MTTDAATVIADLAAEQDAIEAMVGGLDEAQWLSPSAAVGWSISDVVLHLAQSEEAVVTSVTGAHVSLIDAFPVEGDTLDEIMDNRVRAERGDPFEVFQRWRTARRAALAALREADPDARYPWAAAPLRPQVMATTRLAEHWAHALDIAEALGVPYPDTARLRHVAWLAHRTLPYGFGLAGRDPQPVYAELAGPDGQIWQYGDSDAPSRITGDAGAFCRVGAHRLAPEDSGLTTDGPYAEAALRVLRNYAA